jgi:hypothetical protein
MALTWWSPYSAHGHAPLQLLGMYLSLCNREGHAGLVAFIVNLMIAAWIKFRRSNITAVVVTCTLTICMLGMFKSIFEWASHLFERRDNMLRSHESSTGCGPAQDVAGLPFDWHRVPCEHCHAPQNMPCTSCAQAQQELKVWMHLKLRKPVMPLLVHPHGGMPSQEAACNNRVESL